MCYFIQLPVKTYFSFFVLKKIQSLFFCKKERKRKIEGMLGFMVLPPHRSLLEYVSEQ